MIYAYARVSTKDQCLDRQFDALTAYLHAAGKQHDFDDVFSDKQSGKDFRRDAYQALKSRVQEGDEVIIKELDRLGRNKEEMKAELAWFRSRKVLVRILDIPTTLIDFQGQDWVYDMVNNILIEVIGAIAEQERNKIKQRQAEGYAAKKARGDWDDVGRPRKAIAAESFADCVRRQQSGELTVAECCRRLGINRSLWYSRLKELTA